MNDQDKAKYKAEGFDALRLYQIDLGLKFGLDISKYADIRFDYEQMEQIRLGLMDNLDVSVYAQPNIPSEEMEHIREKLMQENGAEALYEEEAKQKRLQNMAIRMVILVICITLGAILFLYKDKVMNCFEILNLELTNEEITLSYGDIFQASEYVKEYTKSEGVFLKLPESFQDNKLGTQTVVYELTNGTKTISKQLIINVIDDEAPILTLKQSEVKLNEGETFMAEDYIVSAIDNVDGDIKKNVQCLNTVDYSNEENEILYSVCDNAGNKTEEVLTVIIQKKEEIKEEKKQEQVIEPVQSTPAPIQNDDETYINPFPSEPIATPIPEQPQQQTQNVSAGGTQYFMFTDGYDIDSAFNACVAEGSKKGSYSCTPIMSDGLYTGYRLDY